MTELRMTYRRYKQSYSDCQTVPNSYDSATKTIIVILPEGRMKKSGTRGQRYHYFWFNGIRKDTGMPVRVCIKAISISNAAKRLTDDCIWDK